MIFFFFLPSVLGQTTTAAPTTSPPVYCSNGNIDECIYNSAYSDMQCGYGIGWHYVSGQVNTSSVCQQCDFLTQAGVATNCIGTCAHPTSCANACRHSLCKITPCRCYYGSVGIHLNMCSISDSVHTSKLRDALMLQLEFDGYIQSYNQMVYALRCLRAKFRLVCYWSTNKSSRAYRSTDHSSAYRRV
jgi:hypothetical protein